MTTQKSINDQKLISLVQARNLIYDKTHRYYTNKIHVRRAWEEISDEMNTTALACQKRWRYLRDYFVRQLHTNSHTANPPQLNTVINNGKRKTHWDLFERLKFLEPFSSTRRGRPKIEKRGYNDDHESQNQKPANHQNDELSTANSLSSNNSGQVLSDLNYFEMMKNQKQLGDYIHSFIGAGGVEISQSDQNEQQLVVDVDEHSDDDGDDDYDAKDSDDNDDEVQQIDESGKFENIEVDDEFPDQQDATSSTQLVQSIIIDDRTSSSTTSISGQSRKRQHSGTYDNFMDFMNSKRFEMECDEHEHFFKSLLTSVRKLNENHIMPFRTEVMQVISKYLYLSQKQNAPSSREDSGNIVVIETDKLHWRRNLKQYNKM